MALSDQQLFDSLSRMPFIDSAELSRVLGEPHATVHRALSDLLADGIAGRVSHGTAHLPSSQRYFLTTKGIRETAGFLGFATPSDFVRAYPASREWLTLLVRRMDAVASIYRLAASMSPGIDGLRSHVEFHRRGRFDATITFHDGCDFGVVRQGLALRRRALYDRLRAIAEYDYTRRPDTVLILVPSVWEERRTTRFCEERNIRDCFVAVESRDALERRDLRVKLIEYHPERLQWVPGAIVAEVFRSQESSVADVEHRSAVFMLTLPAHPQLGRVRNVHPMDLDDIAQHQIVDNVRDIPMNVPIQPLRSVWVRRMLRARRLRLHANQSSTPTICASSSTTDLAPSFSPIKFLHPPVQLRLLRFRVRPGGSCASCPDIPSRKTSAAPCNLTLDRNRDYLPCYPHHRGLVQRILKRLFWKSPSAQRNRSEAFGVYSPIHISKMVLPTVNLGPPNLIKSRTFTLRFTLGL